MAYPFAHFVLNTMKKTAKPDSWQTKPMPAQVAVLDYSVTFTEEEFERISAGCIPRDMEDKWFMYVDGNKLHMHRSWTGHCIYQVIFEHEKDNWVARQAMVNRNPDQYRETDNDYDARLLHFLIVNLLLERNEPFPERSDLPIDAATGLYQHHVAGTGYPETK